MTCRFSRPPNKVTSPVSIASMAFVLANTLARLAGQLTIAVRDHDELTMRQILAQYPALVNYASVSVELPIKVAVARGFTRAVNFLLDRGADINVMHDETQLGTLLHYTAVKGQVGMLRFLLHRGADPNILNAQNETPLHTVIRRYMRFDNVDASGLMAAANCVQALLQAGADPNIEFDNTEYTVHDLVVAAAKQLPLHYKYYHICILSNLNIHGALPSRPLGAQIKIEV